MGENDIMHLVERLDINDNDDYDKLPTYRTFKRDLDLCRSMITLPQGTKMLNTEVCYVKKGIEKPIGITMLINGNIVVGDRCKDVVNIYDAQSGSLIKTVEPGKSFQKPSHMTTLQDGRLVIGDNNGLQLFDEEGNYIQHIAPHGVYGKRYGVTSDMNGNVLVINTNPNRISNCVTKPGETDVLRIDFEKGTIKEKIELVDIIDDAMKSKCRFMHCDGHKVYVVDLGLSQIYVITLGKPGVRKFGKAGKGPGEFLDPAGIVVDSFGNMIISDAGNHRLQVFDKKRNYQGFVKLSARIHRPSGILLDSESKALYVLNLRGNSFVKVKLSK